MIKICYKQALWNMFWTQLKALPQTTAKMFDPLPVSTLNL